MSFHLQKAGVWKRFSAWLFDFIFVVMFSFGFATATSAIINYEQYSVEMDRYYAQYEEHYGVDFDITQEEYDALGDEEKAKYDEARQAYAKDGNVIALQGKILERTMLILCLGIFFAYLVWYFIIPLLFGYGQTLGKKLFGLAVVRANTVKATNQVLFIRAMVGQYAIETMFPVLMIVMIWFGAMGVVGLITIGLLLILQIVMLCVTQTNSAIHDLLTDTVVVDYASQRIFETEEDLIAYKAQLAAEKAAQSENVETLGYNRVK